MNVAYIHAPNMGNYKEVLSELIDRILRTGLYDKLDKIYVNIMDGDFKIDLSKIEYVRIGTVRDYEYPTLGLLYENSMIMNDNDNILYIHLKGVSYFGDKDRESKSIAWRDFLSHFMIDKHNDCLKALETVDVCSVNFRTDPSVHFSGNFWWAKAEHIKTLINPTDPVYTSKGRYYAEFWISKIKGRHDLDFTHKSLWQDQHNWYYGILPKEVYAG